MKRIKKFPNGRLYGKEVQTTGDEVYDKINELIDLVYSQQEAIEKLDKRFEKHRHWAMVIAEKQQDRIEKLERRTKWLENILLETGIIADFWGEEEPADDKPKGFFSKKTIEENPELVIYPAEDTHRTVTLRIPKGMTIAEAIWRAFNEYAAENYSTRDMSDTDLQKALDEVKE